MTTEDFTELVDLASERLGGAVVYANDEFFAPKENLLKAGAPVFIDGKYTERGKWMDGWESRRRRTPGFDWCLVRLGLPGRVSGFVVDTSYFRGNYPESCSVDACAVGANADVEQLLDEKTRWTEILPPTPLRGHSQNHIRVASGERFTHLRFKIYPDGGVARLRVYGEVMPDWERVARGGFVVDLSAVENGGLVVSTSDEFFGHRHNLIMPGRARNMSDGWETKRRRGPGHDWAVVKLGALGMIRSVEVDTSHFKGNFPESCSLEVCRSTGLAVEDPVPSPLPWQEILPRTRLQGHARHFFEEELKESGAVTHVKLKIYPDGGISRLRVYGKLNRSDAPHVVPT